MCARTPQKWAGPRRGGEQKAGAAGEGCERQREGRAVRRSLIGCCERSAPSHPVTHIVYTTERPCATGVGGKRRGKHLPPFTSRGPICACLHSPPPPPLLSQPLKLSVPPSPSFARCASLPPFSLSAFLQTPFCFKARAPVYRQQVECVGGWGLAHTHTPRNRVNPVAGFRRWVHAGRQCSVGGGDRRVAACVRAAVRACCCWCCEDGRRTLCGAVRGARGLWWRWCSGAVVCCAPRDQCCPIAGSSPGPRAPCLGLGRQPAFVFVFGFLGGSRSAYLTFPCCCVSAVCWPSLTETGLLLLPPQHSLHLLAERHGCCQPGVLCTDRGTRYGDRPDPPTRRVDIHTFFCLISKIQVRVEGDSVIFPPFPFFVTVV